MSIIAGRHAEPGILPYRYSPLFLDLEHFPNSYTSPEIQTVRQQKNLLNRYPVYRSQCLPGFPHTPLRRISPQRPSHPSLLPPLDPTTSIEHLKARSMTMLVMTMPTTTLAGLSLSLHADTTRMSNGTRLTFLLHHLNRLMPGMASLINHFLGS